MFELVCDGPSHRRASPLLRAQGSIALLGAALLAGGCLREPAPCLLDLDEGDLVITEIRGPQQGADTRGEWFELYNASGDTVDLRGLRGSMINFKGSAVGGQLGLTFLVRESLVVEPGGYVVLGSLASPPPEVDYSFHDDFQTRSNFDFDDIDGVPVPPDQDSNPRKLFSNAILQFFACDRLIDRIVYDGLPTAGTYSLDGAQTPDADINHDRQRWCTNDTPAPSDGPITELGLPGSPGEANPPCSP